MFKDIYFLYNIVFECKLIYYFIWCLIEERIICFKIGVNIVCVGYVES